jgi:hypothetical protein
MSTKSILFVSSVLPLFDKDSGSNRLKEIIEIFLTSGYTCYFLVDSIKNQEKYFDFFTNKGLIIIDKERNDDISQLSKIDYVWFNGPNSFKKNLTSIKDNLPNAKIVYDMVDIHFLRYKRVISLNPFQISNYNRYFKYKKIETKLAKKADIIIAISEKEKIIMSNIINPDKIIVVSNIHYSKIKLEEVISFKERNDLLFIGSTHTPNIDAVNYLFKEIMPLVWKKNPIIKVNIIGNLNEKIKDLNHPNFTFLGYVENIEPYFLNSKIMIAPLRYGAGVKGKIGQAYEYFLPVITTDIGAEGMNLKHNENAIIVNTPEAFANQILNLNDNEILWTKLSKSAASVLENFSKEELTAKLKQFN